MATSTTTSSSSLMKRLYRVLFGLIFFFTAATQMMPAFYGYHNYTVTIMIQQDQQQQQQVQDQTSSATAVFSTSSFDVSFLTNTARETINTATTTSLTAANATTTTTAQPQLQRAQQQQQSKQPQELAMFYNVYIPTIEKRPKQAYNVVLEQLKQVAESDAANDQKYNLTIYYNTIGHARAMELVQGICDIHIHAGARFQCVPLRHYETAFEYVTLQSMHDYCSASPTGNVEDEQHHQRRLVIYMHSKGTYNYRGGSNDWWRRHMTSAVTSRHCLDRTDSTRSATLANANANNATAQEPKKKYHEASCDMCGLKSFGLPWIHFSGNFFTADCRYISKLLPLPTFQVKMHKLAKEARHGFYNTSKFVTNMFKRDDGAYLGLDRYGAEYWPGSHPSVRLCDLSHPNIRHWQKKRGYDTKTHGGNDIPIFKFAPFPERPTQIEGMESYKGLRRKPSRRFREYYALAGNLHRWLDMYNTTPPVDSWIWSYFPDGKIWRQGVQDHGRNVVDVMLRPYYQNERPLRAQVTHYGPRRNNKGAAY